MFTVLNIKLILRSQMESAYLYFNESNTFLGNTVSLIYQLITNCVLGGNIC